MRISEKQLRRFIWEAATDKNTSQDLAAISQKIADPRTTEHSELEKKPLGSEHLMRFGDTYYNDFERKYPAVSSGFTDAVNAFQRAKAKRLAYLENNFADRLKALEKKIRGGDYPDEAVEEMKQAMIDRVKKSELFFGKYGESLKPSATLSDGGGYYIAADDSDSGWSLMLSSVGKGSRVLAFAPRSTPSVVSMPPFLSLNAAGEVTNSWNLSDIEQIYEHELIHQEDWAVSIQSHGERSNLDGAVTNLTKDLIVSAMLPPGQLTGEMIISRMRASPALKSLIEPRADDLLGDNESTTERARAVAAVIVVATFAQFVNSSADDYSIISDYIMGLFPAGTDMSTPDPASLIDLTRTGRKEYGLIFEILRDRTSGTHLRATLSLLRPHLERALKESEDPDAVIESALSSMNAQTDEEASRAAFILAVTDPKKLADLTMVAAREPRAREAGPETALAEGLTRRWAQLAGLLKG